MKKQLMLNTLDFLFIRIPLIILGMILSPIMYLTKRKVDKVWNKNITNPYKLHSVFNSIWGNDEDGIYFDPTVLKHKSHLLKNKYRYTFIDFFKWNIIRNPIHNYVLIKRGLNLKYVDDIRHHDYEYSCVYKDKGLHYIEKTIQLPFNKRLELRIGPRIGDIRYLQQFIYQPSEYVTEDDVLKAKTEGYKYLSNRGYKYIRNTYTMRIKTNKG